MNVNDFASQEGDSDSTATAVAEPKPAEPSLSW